MKGVGLLVPISFPFEDVNIAIVGFGLEGGGKGGGSQKGLKGEEVSWLTGFRLEEKNEAESSASYGNRSLSGSLWVNTDSLSGMSMSSWGSRKAVLSVF